MNASLDFFDSNVLLYGIDADAPTEKRRTSRELIGHALANQSAVISWQVVQETLNVATHDFKASISAAERVELLRDVLQPLWMVQPDTALHSQAIDLQKRLGFAYYDSRCRAWRPVGVQHPARRRRPGDHRSAAGGGRGWQQPCTAHAAA